MSLSIVSVIFVRFNENLNALTVFRKSMAHSV